MLEELERDIKQKLKIQPVSSRILLDRLVLLDDASRKTSQYQDPNYLPFYYYLAKTLSSKTVFQVGLDIGLPLCCYLMGCPSVENILAFQRQESSFYSPRIATSNIRAVRPSLSLKFYAGQFLDEPLETIMSSGMDSVLITCKQKDEDLNDILYSVWKHLSLGGIVVVDHMRSNSKSFDVFKSFCKTQNREYVFFETRYGNAVVQK
jgi:hypothetical protein